MGSLSDLTLNSLCECGEPVARRKSNDKKKVIVQSRLCRACLALKQRYGMSKADREAKLDEQGGKCLTCSADIEFNGLGSPGLNSAVIDHCHTSGKVRGILCRCCNVALGNVKDNADTLRRLAAYLEENDG